MTAGVAPSPLRGEHASRAVRRLNPCPWGFNSVRSGRWNVHVSDLSVGVQVGVRWTARQTSTSSHIILATGVGGGTRTEVHALSSLKVAGQNFAEPPEREPMSARSSMWLIPLTRRLGGPDRLEVSPGAVLTPPLSRESTRLACGSRARGLRIRRSVCEPEPSEIRPDGSLWRSSALGGLRSEGHACRLGTRSVHVRCTISVWRGCVRTSRIEDTYVQAIMDRYSVRTKTEAVELALRHLAGQPMTREEALAMRGVRAILETPADAEPRGSRVILADTSAWVEYDRATGSAVDRRLTDLIATDGPVAISEPILMEVLAGARTDEREADLRRLLLRFDLCSFDAATDFDAAVRIYRRCRKAGITPRRMVDCMIASVAWRREVKLLAYDVDLDRVARLVGIELDEASLRAPN